MSAGVRQRAHGDGHVAVRRPASRSAAARTALVAGALGAIPVLAVLGAVPGRRPTLLIEWMFRGFVTCALDAGALNPLVMVCDRAGVPLGMHQLDGGLTYPLGGLLVRAGVDPLAAWKVAVALPVVVGFAALFWLGRRLSGSAAVAAGLVAVVGLNGTLAARTWNWYWNTVAIVLLPLLFAALHVLFVRAQAVRWGRRPATTLVAPAALTVVAACLAGIEWQYAALFAAAVVAAGTGLLAAANGWTGRQRAAVLAWGVAGVGLLGVVMRWRLSVAGIAGQFDGSLANAADEGVDLAALVLPDGRTSLLGVALRLIGLRGVLADTVSDGRMLWVAPYLGVGLIVLTAWLLVHRRPHVTDDALRPRGYIALLLVVAAGALVLSLGPEWRLASLAAPDVGITSPLAWLWRATPLQWIRYPWTWHAVTFLAGSLALVAVLAVVVRDRDDRTSLLWGVAALVAVELVSPQVLGSVLQAAPSVGLAPARLTADAPEIARFDAAVVPELQDALADAGMVTLLPWGNTWVIPYLGPAAGIPMRNVGIDRNLSQAEAAAPVTRAQLRGQRGAVVDRLITSGWTDAVVVVDYIPYADYIVRHTRGEVLQIDIDQLRRNRRTIREAVRHGYCADRHPWFTVLTECG